MGSVSTHAPTDNDTSSRPIVERFLGSQHDCSYASDPRVNKDLCALLSGQNVVIAGAGRGVGRATAEFFAHTQIRSLSLMALELHEVDETARLCKAINPKLQLKTAAFDVRDYSAVQTFIDSCIATFGSITTLFMNAGLAPQWLDTHESDPSAWWATLSVSLQGAFNFSRAVLPHMRSSQPSDQPTKRIIFTSSSGAHAPRGMGGYVIGKLGQVRLAEIIHNENKEYNIKCFAYHPGAIPTRFFHDFKDATLGKELAKDSYVDASRPSDLKSAENAVHALESTTFSTPQMPAGLVTVLASGTLDFMSGRYLDASVKIADYVDKKDEIVREDLHRVRLVVSKEEGWFVPTGSD